jgi:sucrose phosphorylase
VTGVQTCALPISQIYYGGLVAAENDMQLLEKTKVGRDINRPYLSFDEIDRALEKNVVQELLQLIYFRNQHESFNGKFEVMDYGDDNLNIRWKKAEHWSELHVNFKDQQYSIKQS